MPRAEIGGNAGALCAQMFECAQMCCRKVVDMDVVANCRPIRCRVIGAVDLDMWCLWPSAALSTSGMRWVSGSWASPSLAVRIGPGGVEIAQRDGAHAIGVVRTSAMPARSRAWSHHRD